MKKIIVSVGLVAAGTAGLQAAYAPDLNSMQTTKVWSASASLRGFYDDNYATAPNGSKRGSYGFEFSPSVSLNKSLQQTEIGVRYTYGLYYYQEREELGQDPVDQTHQLDLWVDHAFTERWQGKVSDTFAVGQEPELLIGGGTPFRVKGNNIANNATLSLNTDWTRQFSTAVTYQNGFYDYQQDNGTPTTPSLAGRLNRVDQSIALDLLWHIAPETTAFVGYQFEQVNYIGNEPIAPAVTFLVLMPSPHLVTVPERFSSDRDNRSHFFYVGIQHNLLANLTVAGRVGVQYTEYYNDSTSSPTVGPYALVSATYTYTPGSYAQIGFIHQRNATDIIAPDASGRITQDQESSMVYGSINHHITPKLLGTLLGSVQYSSFNEGQFANNSDVDYSLGLNLNYAFTKHFSAEAGYNYDDLTSNISGRGYTRNRVYLGVTAAF